MDFEKLHEPYKGVDSPSPEAQMTWLEKIVPKDVAARAMLQVYTQLEQGTIKFEETKTGHNRHSAGWNMCQYLKAVAVDLHTKATRAYLEVLSKQDEAQKQKVKEEVLKRNPKTLWSRIKAVVSDPYKEVT